MKKTKAVAILREIILTHMNCDAGCCNDDDIMYNTILNEIEDKIGMSPPLVKSDSFTLRLWEEE